jgi:hypothetical protein
MKEQIMKRLKEIENKNNITILLAVESGSRAWGQNNENSDYDIRFIYKHNDLREYMVLNKFNDVMESNNGEFDLVGWDIKKALYLHFKSNPNLREWLISPIVYIPDEIGIFDGLPEFNPQVLKHHYYGLAYNSYKSFLVKNQLDKLKLVKKELYAVRCILAYNVLENGILPSMNIVELLGQCEIDDKIKESILTLREAYSNLAIEEIDEEYELVYSWIEESLENFEKTKVGGPKRNIEEYNKRFHQILGVD